MRDDRSAQQIAVLWVVRTACTVFLGGTAAMVYLSKYDIAIPDQLDRLVNLAGVGALALLGRTSDTRAEAQEGAKVAAEKMVDDLAALAPPAPVEVVGEGGGPVQTIDAPDKAATVKAKAKAPDG